MKNAESLLKHENFVLNAFAPVALTLLPMVAGAAFLAAFVLSGPAALTAFLIGIGLTFISGVLIIDTINLYRFERLAGTIADEFANDQVRHYRESVHKAAQQFNVLYANSRTADEMHQVELAAKAAGFIKNNSLRYEPLEYTLTSEQFIENKLRDILK